ncbi:hypothetical protein QE152_g39803 [Popillia japonica]|uniref:Uncharacterized protein n=1 Tax=Popillia japonica TaxID=7064 RepID=A0AAW1HT14_POPJA
MVTAYVYCTLRHNAWQWGRTVIVMAEEEAPPPKVKRVKVFKWWYKHHHPVKAIMWRDKTFHVIWVEWISVKFCSTTPHS